SPGVVSPAGMETVAVFVREPAAEGLSTSLYVKRMLSRSARLRIVSVRLPVPLEPSVPLQAPEVVPAGKASFTERFVAVEGPLLRSEERRVGKVWGSGVVAASVFVISTSASGVRVSTSVAV